MSEKTETLQRILKAKIVAVVRGSSKEEAKQSSIACIKGGVKGIEVAFTAPDADQVIAELSEEYQDDSSVLIGAGTVLDPATARIAIIAGAKFIVSAAFNPDVALLCNLYGIPYIPGCLTPTEVQHALSYGAEIIKIFPGSVAGMSVAKELHGPFPNAEFMITGGVSLANVGEWFDTGAAVLGVGGQLVGPGAKGDFDQVTKQAKAFISATK